MRILPSFLRLFPTLSFLFSFHLLLSLFLFSFLSFSFPHFLPCTDCTPRNYRNVDGVTLVPLLPLTNIQRKLTGIGPSKVSCLLCVWNVPVANNACEIESEYVKNINYSFLSKFLVSYQLCKMFFNFILFFH